jgi:hypothetical protein
LRYLSRHRTRRLIAGMRIRHGFGVFGCPAASGVRASM